VFLTPIFNPEKPDDELKGSLLNVADVNISRQRMYFCDPHRIIINK
jgi:hypothetical protein